LAEQCTEKYGKKLIGRTDMADALKRLDKLTEEEARMAVAQNLEATHTVDESVRGVENTMITGAGVDDRVAEVDDRVPRVDNVDSLDDQGKGINAGVASVDRVEVVGDKVAEIIDGAQIVLSQAREVSNNLNRLDGKETKQVIKQIANDVDQAKRPSSPNLISTDYRA
jgi:hypothetical protein